MLRINLKGVTTHLLSRQSCFRSHWWPSLLHAFYKTVQVNCAIISRHLKHYLLIILSYYFPPTCLSFCLFSVHTSLPAHLYLSIHQSSYLSLFLNLSLGISVPSSICSYLLIFPLVTFSHSVSDRKKKSTENL